jgi:15-cis-phytoene synthase
LYSLFNIVSEMCSKTTTEQYSTSFSSAIKLLDVDLRQPVYNLYGFVRFADEIVDTFHDFDKEKLLNSFEKDTYEAIESGISLNPILNSFQLTINKYKIDLKLVDAFLFSMRWDLTKKDHDIESYKKYIYGSAEVVGLMCLYVFCNGNKEAFEKLKSSACSLGSAFQKVNFLRDIKADLDGLERVYFPNCDFNNFTNLDKFQIEKDIQKDFDDALVGIYALPNKARFGVYVAYKYYLSLFKKIKKTAPQGILQTRIRIPNYQKAYIVARASVKNQLRMI